MQRRQTCLEERSADFLIHRLCEFGFQISNSGLDILFLLRQHDGFVINGDEPRQRKFIHWINVLELDDAEEDDGCMIRDRTVAVTGLVNFFLRRRGNFLLGRDFLR